MNKDLCFLLLNCQSLYLPEVSSHFSATYPLEGKLPLPTLILSSKSLCPKMHRIKVLCILVSYYINTILRRKVIYLLSFTGHFFFNNRKIISEEY